MLRVFSAWEIVVQSAGFRWTCSEITINFFEVPQSSNVRSLLFLLYINDISYALCFTSRLFADDTCQVVHAPNPSTLRKN